MDQYMIVLSMVELHMGAKNANIFFTRSCMNIEDAKILQWMIEVSLICLKDTKIDLVELEDLALYGIKKLFMDFSWWVSC